MHARASPNNTRRASISSLYSTTPNFTMPRSFGTEISANRRSNSELSSEVRSAIIAKRDEGASIQNLAEEFGCHRNTISKTINRYKQHNTLRSLPRTGRPEATTVREKRVLYQIARKIPKINYRNLRDDAGLQHQQKPPSRTTMYRILKKKGLINHRSATRPKLDESHARLRRLFSKKTPPF